MDSSERHSVADGNREDTDNVENEALLHSWSAPETNRPYSQTLRSFDGSPACIALGVILPAIFGLGVFGAYQLNKKGESNGGDAKQNNGLVISTLPTILISIDGFRHDYLYRSTQAPGTDGKNQSVALAPTLQRLSSRGVTASPGMQPVMPSVTFPNHWSIATGLYPENHGIISNTMYSPVTHKWFHYSGDDPHWWSGEPIWQTLRQTPRFGVLPNGTRSPTGDNFTTASVFWVGSDVLKHAPTAFWKYNSKVSYEDRVDRAMSLLTGTAKDLDGKADFITMYFEHVDTAGHQHGPDSAEVDTEIARVDRAIESLVSRLEQAFGEKYNIVIVSDHGMSEVDDSRVVNLTAVIPSGTVQDIERTPFGMWMNVTEPADRTYSILNDYLRRTGMHAKVYRKHELPDRWHLSHSEYVPAVVTVAELGWTVKYPHVKLVPGARVTSVSALEGSKFKKKDAHRRNERGTHGFDNKELEMYALFIAAGPAFRSGKSVSGLRSIDVYPMLCHMFDAKPAPNNGSLDLSTKFILAK